MPRPRATTLQLVNLLALFVPGVGFGVGLLLLFGDARFVWLAHPAAYPWELWAIAGAGLVATAAGVGDWLYHLRGHRVVGPGERRAEFLALACGGVPLFVLMSVASVSATPGVWFLPALLVALGTVVLVCYDEFTFHRRCEPLERAYHRVLTLGNGTAWCAWAHWCFAGG